jgi:two-component system, chemotaxis family, sensor kinase CheA
MGKGDSEFQKRLLATFKGEAAEHVQALSAGLIELERDAASPEKRIQIIETVFRGAHSLKGAARAVGVTQIETICQALESVFSVLKREELGYSPALLDVLHDAVDALSKSLEIVGSEPTVKERSPNAGLLRRLELAAKGTEVSSAKPLGSPDAALLQNLLDQHRPQAEERIASSDTVRIDTTRLDALLFRAEGLLSAKLTSVQRASEIRETADQLSTLVRERAKAAPAVKAVQQGLEKAANANRRGHINSEARKLLEFMTWESALVKSFEARLDALARFAEHDCRSLGAMVDGLLEDMKKALMLPVSSALGAFPKFLRDVSKAQGKEVDLVVRGDDIEIDRRILEAMRDPLMHLLRNCIDHGIETPEARKLKGKPPRGTITVDVARKDGSTVEMLVSDDGAGIDSAKVERAAQKLGIGLQPGRQVKEEAERLALVFHSGVSTSPIVTDISGRGLGLAIVRRKWSGWAARSRSKRSRGRERISGSPSR